MEQLKKLEEKVEGEEPATKRSREYTDLGLDLDKKDNQLPAMP